MFYHPFLLYPLLVVGPCPSPGVHPPGISEIFSSELLAVGAGLWGYHRQYHYQTTVAQPVPVVAGGRGPAGDVGGRGGKDGPPSRQGEMPSVWSRVRRCGYVGQPRRALPFEGIIRVRFVHIYRRVHACMCVCRIFVPFCMLCVAFWRWY